MIVSYNRYLYCFFQRRYPEEADSSRDALRPIISCEGITMKFIYIYCILLICFLSNNPALGKSYVGVDKCQSVLQKCLNIKNENTKNICVTSSSGEYQQCLAKAGLSNNTQAYHPENESFKYCRDEKKVPLNTSSFSKCVSDHQASLQAKKTPAIKAPTTKEPVTKSPEEKTPIRTERSTTTCDGVAAGDCTCSAGVKKTMIKNPDSTMDNSTAIYKCETVAASKTPISSKFDVDKCLSGIKYYVDICRDDSEKAVASCDPDQQAESNSDTAFDMKNILNAANNLALKKGAGSGAYETCLQTALITQAGYYTTDQLKQTCEPQVARCEKSCGTAKNFILEKQNEIYLNCKELALDDDSNLTGDEFDTKYGGNITTQLSELNALSDEATQACVNDAADYKAQIAQASKDFNNAAKQAQVCRCQTGSTGEDCNAIQGPAECALNPNAAGCSMSTVNCNNSDSLQCRCARNPNLAECKPGNGGPSAFASINGGFKPTTSNGGSQKISDGDFDISFDEESNLAAVSGTSGSPTSPFGSAQAGGSGGGGGSGAGAGGEGDPAAVAADGEGGLKHLLDKPKTMLNGLLNKMGFGNGSLSDKKYKTDANGKKIDPSKWKPGMLRGVAGDGSEIGPKHRDIWKQMNSQYFLQEKTFLQEK